MSYLIPTVRFDGFCREAVESVLRDTTLFSREIVVVFDGHIEDEKIPRWLQHTEIRVIETGRRSGIGAALNLACEASTGRFLGRLDSDDRQVFGRTDLQVKFLIENGDVGVVGSRAAVIDSAGCPAGIYPGQAGEDVRVALLSYNAIVHSSAMIRRRAFESLGGYDPTWWRMQDYELWLRMARDWRLAVMDWIGVEYRVHDRQSGLHLRHRLGTLIKLCRMRDTLAVELVQSRLVQLWRNALYVAGSLVYSLGISRPRYQRSARVSRAKRRDSRRDWRSDGR